MLITYIIIAVMLIVLVWVIFGNIKLTSENIELKEEAAEFKEEIEQLGDARDKYDAACFGVLGEWEIKETTYSYYVVRKHDIVEITARWFPKTDDPAYARLLAEELCDKLNEGL